MTDQQKFAIGILNRLRSHGNDDCQLLTDDEYFALMDFIVGTQQAQVTFVPGISPPPVITPLYETPAQPPVTPYRTTCSGKKPDL